MVRWTAYVLATALLLAAGTQLSGAQKSKSKSTNTHSDFIWMPSSPPAAAYNPKEIKIHNSVPWQKSGTNTKKGGSNLSPWTTTHGSGGGRP